MGRLFDAVSALLGVCRVQTYEGQAAIELEGIADRTVADAYACTIDDTQGALVMEGPMIAAQAAEDLANGVPVGTIAARFHNTVAAMSAEAAQQAASAADVDLVALSGGCFQNAFLMERLVPLLHRQGLRTVCHRVLSPGDECISFGQVVIAGSVAPGPSD
jgi:hydrogenase maturation protein HypF